MIPVRTYAFVAVALTVGGASLQAEDLSRYRDFQLGSTLASVQKTSATTAGDVKVIHQRPAVIQELRWRVPVRYSGATESPEPVREAIFTFYNDQLFQIVVDYDRTRTEGLTDADLVEAISRQYGEPVQNATARQTTAPTASPSMMPANTNTVVARWSDANTSITLVRTIYPTTLRLVLTLTSLEALAETAAADAIRQDREEAPQRESDRAKKTAEDSRAAEEKARAVNKPRFKP